MFCFGYFLLHRETLAELFSKNPDYLGVLLGLVVEEVKGKEKCKLYSKYYWKTSSCEIPFSL